MTDKFAIDTLLAQLGNRSDEKQERSLHQSISLRLMDTVELTNRQALIIRERKIQHVRF